MKQFVFIGLWRWKLSWPRGIRLSFKIAPVQITNLARQMTVMRTVDRGIIGISSKDGRVVW